MISHTFRIFIMVERVIILCYVDSFLHFWICLWTMGKDIFGVFLAERRFVCSDVCCLFKSNRREITDFNLLNLRLNPSLVKSSDIKCWRYFIKVIDTWRISLTPEKLMPKSPRCLPIHLTVERKNIFQFLNHFLHEIRITRAVKDER